jgi:HSP20 family protein
MALIHWQPYREMETLRRQMNQMLDEMASVNRQPIAWKPAVELRDRNDSLVLRAEIPGVEGKDLNVQVTREAVAISGEHHQEKTASDRVRTEFRYGKFQRVIALPVAIQNDKVQAEFKDGILTLTLPKVTEARRSVVKIDLADKIAATPEVTDSSASNNHADATPEAELATV